LQQGKKGEMLLPIRAEKTDVRCGRTLVTSEGDTAWTVGSMLGKVEIEDGCKKTYREGESMKEVHDDISTEGRKKIRVRGRYTRTGRKRNGTGSNTDDQSRVLLGMGKKKRMHQKRSAQLVIRL